MKASHFQLPKEILKIVFKIKQVHFRSLKYTQKRFVWAFLMLFEVTSVTEVQWLNLTHNLRASKLCPKLAGRRCEIVCNCKVFDENVSGSLRDTLRAFKPVDLVDSVDSTWCW